MKFKEIINRHEWLSIEIIFLKLYPDQKKLLADYREIFESLKTMEPLNCDDVDIEFDQWEKAVSVSGRNKKPKKEDISDGVALEFRPWKEWLGMSIAAITLKEFTELEIIAHCLYEMTFIGFDEKEIQD